MDWVSGIIIGVAVAAIAYGLYKAVDMHSSSSGSSNSGGSSSGGSKERLEPRDAGTDSNDHRND